MGKRYFPLFIDLSEKNILVVGGGQIACRRVRTLLSFAEAITVVAPRVCPELEALCRERGLNWLAMGYYTGVLRNMDMVLAATDCREVNRKVWEDCKRAQAQRKRTILVNTADDKSLCDFYFPAVVCTDDVAVGINSGGNSPSKVRQARQEIEALLKDCPPGKETGGSKA